jgi:hypothetical protein
MKRVLFILVLALFFVFETVAQEYKIVTIVESIVPMGVGRSRMIDNKSDVELGELTTERTDGSSSDQGRVSRKDAKVDNFEEIKLLNFYSAFGINFQNIASNDAIISAKINNLTAEGWKLTFVTSAVESDAGKGDGNGIFVTRLFFMRE